MPLFSRRPGRSLLGRAVGTGVRGVRLLTRGSVAGGRLVTRSVGRARARGAGGETGMMRLFDLHAASCAGDTLIAIGLAGTIFFNVPLGEARSKVALYLLVTMVPFALLAPVVGPVLDHFRHGRRYAMAATMLGRAFLAWLISDYIHGFGLYPAAFGVLALSRAYGVARSAAVPRLLPERIGLSQAGARASVYGTIAGALVAPIGLVAFKLGPQWPVRVASVIFLVGMVIALRLPPKADSEPPEQVPRPFRTGLRRGTGERALSGRLVTATLTGSAILRGMYGFLLLFLAFAIKAGDLDTSLLGRDLGDKGALGLVGGALAVGTFLATAVGTRLRVHQPAALQSTGMVLVALVAVLAALRLNLLTAALLCLVTAVISGIAKLVVDACIQERVPERSRASAFAHSETALMLAFVAGGGLGLVPFDGRLGVGVAAGLGALAAVRAVLTTSRLRDERLLGRAMVDPEPVTGPVTGSGPSPVSTPSTTTGASDTVGRVADLPASPVTTRTDDPGGPAASRTVDAPAAPVDPAEPPPGFHIYRPSSAAPRRGIHRDGPSREPQGPLK